MGVNIGYIVNRFLPVRITGSDVPLEISGMNGTSLASGQKAITSGAAQRLGTSQSAYKSFTIKADENNQGNIYIGGVTSMTPSTGFILPPGSSISLTGKLSPYVILLAADNNNDKVTWLGVL